MRKTARLMVILMLAYMISGCTTIVGSSAVRIPLVPPISEKEVVDYYKEQLAFDTVATKEQDDRELTYETKPVTGDKADELKELVRQIESVLGGMEYEYSKELDNILKESNFHYIKAVLNDKKLESGEILSIDEALGHYFVDVNYQIGPRTAAQFTPKITLVGLHGVFERTRSGIDVVNERYLEKAIDNINTHYMSNRIDKAIILDPDTKGLRVGKADEYGGMSGNYDNYDTAETNLAGTAGLADGLDSSESDLEDQGNTGENTEENVGETIDDVEDTTGNEDETVENVGDAEQDVNDNIEEIEGTGGSGDSGPRKIKINAMEFNNIAGSPTYQSAYLPELSIVMDIPQPEGTISGMGIYPSGDGGLRKFGYDRKQTSGTLRMRYVFKTDVMETDKIYGIQVYPVFYEINAGIDADTESVTVPEFLMTEFSKLLERSDRAIANGDMSALMSGGIYDDAGMAVLSGYFNQYTNVLRHISTIRRVVARDIENNAYLLEVETIRQEGPKGMGRYATYRDKSYVAVEQVGDRFIITDTVCMFRNITKQPPIDPDNSIVKRLVALNLAGEVPEESKGEIERLIKEFYTASTARILHGPREVNIGGQNVTLERGMYDCFNDDTSMLSSSRKEYINSTVREMLTKKGIDVQAEYKGVITEWIGGAENQAEFTTEEVIEYKGQNSGVYMQVYYLVSNMNDVWVIDDMKIIESEEKSGAELQQVLDRSDK